MKMKKQKGCKREVRECDGEKKRWDCWGFLEVLSVS